MTACQILPFVPPAAAPRVQRPVAEELSPFEVWDRFLLEDEPHPLSETDSLDRWLDLNA
jgi:hypothetical protein